MLCAVELFNNAQRRFARRRRAGHRPANDDVICARRDRRGGHCCSALVACLASLRPHAGRNDYQFAAARLTVPPARCLYVGENLPEVLGALAAGMKAVLKPCPPGRDLPG